MHGQITFFLLAAIAVLSTVMMVSSAKTVHSAIFLALTLLATSGIFLQLRAPLLFAAQLLAVACLLMGVIIFAIEVGTADVALAAEYSWRYKTAGILAAIAPALVIAFALLQRRLWPGEKLTELLPRAPLPWPLSISEITLSFYSHDLLPMALLLFILLIAAIGIGAVSQRRA